MYVKCHEISKSNCRARGTTNGGPITLSTTHNHPPNFDTELIYNFMKNLYTSVITSLRDLRLIYDEISIRHSRAGTLIPFVKIVRTMQTWRKVNCPALPKTLEEYVTRFNTRRWKNFFLKTNSNLTVARVIGTDGSEAIVFLDQTLLQNFQRVHLYADATYKICPRRPKKIYQFFTIMASIHDTVVPVFWSLMSRKTKPCYMAVLNYFKHFCAHLQVLSVTTDYEIGLRNVFRIIYPMAIIIGCLFHFVQALIKKAKKLGLWEQLFEWEDGKEFFRKIIALAFLPACHIRNAFNYLLNVYAVFIPTFYSFLLYFQNYWMNYVKPENWSVFEYLDRTNNVVEANNRRLNVKFGIHPRIWQFTELLIGVYEITKIEILSLKMSLPVRRSRRPEDTLRNAIISRAWELYTQQTLDVGHFLECMSHVVPILRNDNGIQNVNDVDNFVNLSLQRYIAVGNGTYIVMKEDDLIGVGGLLLILD